MSEQLYTLSFTRQIVLGRDPEALSGEEPNRPLIDLAVSTLSAYRHGALSEDSLAREWGAYQATMPYEDGIRGQHTSHTVGGEELLDAIAVFTREYPHAKWAGREQERTAFFSLLRDEDLVCPGKPEQFPDEVSASLFFEGLSVDERTPPLRESTIPPTAASALGEIASY